MAWLVFLLSILLPPSVYGQTQNGKAKECPVALDSLDRLPVFSKGKQAWHAYLYEHIDMEKIIGEMDSTQYIDYGARQTAIVRFTINTLGRLDDITLENKQALSPTLSKGLANTTSYGLLIYQSRSPA